MYIPDEYRFTGVSMNLWRPAKSTMASSLLVISRRDRPRIEPFR
jgi:hypothetical protein